VISDPAIDATAIEPARVRLKLQSGRVVEAFSDTIKGSPQEPLTEDELLQKFRACLAFGLGASRTAADRLAELVMTLEHRNDAAGSIVGAFPGSRAEA
jgi:2-methylcitrate dehydratase PrpD